MMRRKHLNYFVQNIKNVNLYKNILINTSQYNLYKNMHINQRNKFIVNKKKR